MGVDWSSLAGILRAPTDPPSGGSTTRVDLELPQERRAPYRHHEGDDKGWSDSIRNPATTMHWLPRSRTPPRRCEAA